MILIMLRLLVPGWIGLMSKETKADLFLELANLDDQGFCDPVSVDRFIGRYEGLKLGNGGSWCRDDGSLAEKFNIVRMKERNKITAIALHGYKKSPIEKPIPKRIRDAIKKQRCVVLGVSSVEVDHKDGRRDDPRLNDFSRVRIDDFQPPSKAANNAKRQHCKECRETNKRFDAKRLGYPKSQVKGNGTYRGSCVGCCWYDVEDFRKRLFAGAD